MLTVVEKVIFLQDLDIHSELPTEQLSYLSAIAAEESFAAHEAVYREQHPAHAMYRVVE